MNIDIDAADDGSQRLETTKDDFQAEDYHTLQTLMDNGTDTPEAQRTCKSMLGIYHKRRQAIFGITKMKLYLTSAKDLKNLYKILATISLSLLPIVNYLVITQRKPLKLY